MDAETREGLNSYQNHLRTMSMCWSGFDPMVSYGATSNYCSHQPYACPTLPMTTTTMQNDQQVIRDDFFNQDGFIIPEKLLIGQLRSRFIKLFTWTAYCLQIMHQFHPCKFVSFAQHFSTLSFNSNNTPSTSSLSSPPAPTKKKPVPVPENMKNEVSISLRTAFFYWIFGRYIPKKLYVIRH